MKLFEINLAERFERVLTRIASLPWGTSSTAGYGLAEDAELKQAIRALYEVANGRQVETPLGWIAIAPPVAAFLKARPFYVEMQMDLLVEAAARIISGPPHSDNGFAMAESTPPNCPLADGRQPSVDGPEASLFHSTFRERDTVHPSGAQMISLHYD